VSAWVVVPCLLALRDEYNLVAPGRDKGADGTIGDSNHKSSSDHTPDEDSDILRDHDADDKNEVHALDIDSSGPWPGGWAWFNASVLDVVERHRLGVDDRLKYVIWNERIASMSWNWTWREYSGPDPHTNHAHFSARYTTAQERDTSDWGVADMPLNTTDKSWLIGQIREGVNKGVVDVLSRASRAAQGKSSGDDFTDKGDVQILQMLRQAVGGPLDEQTLVSAIVAKLPTSGAIPSSAPINEDALRDAVEAGVREVLRTGVNEI
jgi:hypothetical protein